jgi:hypothetical protein
LNLKNYINPVKSDFGGFLYLSSFDKVAPVFQVISQGCVLTYEIWWICGLLNILLPTAAHTTHMEERGRERKGSPPDIDYAGRRRGWFCAIDPNNITQNRGSLHLLCTKNIKSAK